MNNKRVLFITSGMCKGGAETQLLKVALYLKSIDYTVKIISLTAINEFELDYENEGISVLFLQSWKYHPIKNLNKLYQTLKSFQPDVVVAFMFIAIIFARLLKMIFHFKLISSIRIAVLTKKWYIPFRVTSGLDDAIVYNSLASKIKFEKYGYVKAKGSIINNGISIPDTKNFTNLKLPKGKFVWVCIAHFRWNKDYNTLFKAIQILKGLNFRVDIIGEYNNGYDPMRTIKNLKIESHVNLLGFKQNASQYLAYADAFVLSSFSEGMPNALLEAMAYQKPVVVTNIDCNSEVLKASKAGFLFEKENAHDLAVKMLDMMRLSNYERNAIGEKGRAYIQNNFAEASVMKHWLNLINHHAEVQKITLNN
jgi:glycosyltransferase involved in cell wall biosynthesis